jgi:ABC-type uncharacterized transport system substrate-binding protein
MPWDSAGNAVRYILCRINRVFKRTSMVVVFLTLTFAVELVRAERHDIQRYDFQIVTTDDTDATKKIVEDLRKRFPSAQVEQDSINRRSKAKNTVYIAIGPSAFRSLLSQGRDGIIVSAFTSSQAYHTILESMPDSRTTSVTAVYAEPSPLMQLRLISMLHKKPVKVAVILSSKTSYLEPMFQHVASQSGTELSIEYYSQAETLNRVLNRVTDVPVILATPDSTIYNADNIRNILVTTYRRNQSVVGFSAALVKAGALASTYSDIEDINAQVDELIADYEKSGKLAEPQFPKYFSTIVNEDVARSLNIVVDDSTKKFSRKPALRQQ